jgi:hypothetical protein
MLLSPRLKRSLLAVAVLTAVELGAMWFLWPEPAIGPASFRRIEVGMPRAEVETIIGLPPGEYYRRLGKLPHFVVLEEKGEVRRDWRPLPKVNWVGSDYLISVSFDDDLVEYCMLFGLSGTSQRQGVLEQIRGWLGW